jgi:hypothetical protein
MVPVVVGETGEGDDGAPRRLLQRSNDHLTDAGALDHDVRLDSYLRHRSSVVVPAELGHQPWLGSRRHQIHDMSLEATLPGEQRSEESNWTGTSN